MRLCGLVIGWIKVTSINLQNKSATLVPFDDYFYGNAYGRTSVSFGRMSVGLDARPNSPIDNIAIRTETKIKIAALTFLCNRSCAYIHS
jgi:hypothetical protein